MDSEGNSTVPFPNFDVCNLVETSIYALIDITAIEPEIEHNFTVDYMRDIFVPAFNSNSSLARLIFFEPATVSTSLYIVLEGAHPALNETEIGFFQDAIRKVADGVLMAKAKPTFYELQGVAVLYQESSSGKRLRILAKDQAFNNVTVVVKAACASVTNCTNDALRTIFGESVTNFAEALQAVLANGPYYLGNITDVTISDDSIPMLPDDSIPILPAANDVPPAGPVPTAKKRKIPEWLLIVIVVNVVIILIVALCVCVHHSIRRAQGEQLQDHDEWRRKASSDRGHSFSAAPAPTFEQVKELEIDLGRNVKEQYNGPVKSVRQLQEDDYDARSYGDEFSIEAGDFTVADGFEAPNRHQTYDSPESFPPYRR